MTHKATSPIYATTARTATPTAVTINTSKAMGLVVVVNVTASSATPSVVFTIDAKDSVSGAFYTLLTSAAITGTGTTALKIHPDLTVATNVAASDLLLQETRITATHGDTDSITYTVSAILLES